MSHLLSKSHFLAGCQCHDLLWRKVHEPDAPELAKDQVFEDRFHQRARVAELALTRFPGGVLIDLPHSAREERVRRTRELLGANVPAIFGATFVVDEVFVVVDVLERDNGGFNLIEVKSTNRVMPEHYLDAAIQTHAVRKAGTDVRRIELMHLNSKCRYPNLSNLFVRADMTYPVEKMLPAIPREIKAQFEMLDGPFPGKGFGEHCVNAPHCPSQGRCFPDMSGDHVMTLHGVGMNKAWALMKAGYQRISELPADYRFNEVNRRQLHALSKGEMVVEDTLAEALEQFKPPLAFLDFETVQLAIPLWVGCMPYEMVPAQFSCYVDDGSGELVHHEWLAEGSGDPREPLAVALIKAVRNARHVVTYNVSFSRACVRRLSAALPHLAADLGAIDAKLVDLLPVVRDHVYHPEFAGSFSIKDVLPALVPGLDHGVLDVSDGFTASVNIAKLMLKPDQFSLQDRKTLRHQLREYCELDTWAMVKLLERLRELVR